MNIFASKFLICPPVFVCGCAFKSQMFMHICLWACVYICVTWGCNFSKDSFIKWGAASEEAVNQFYLLCVGVSSLGTPGPCHQWKGLAGFCCCSCVVIGWSGKGFYPVIILSNSSVKEESVSNIIHHLVGRPRDTNQPHPNVTWLTVDSWFGKMLTGCSWWILSRSLP